MNETFIVSNLIREHKVDLIFLIETWLGSDGACVLNEISPAN